MGMYIYISFSLSCVSFLSFHRLLKLTSPRDCDNALVNSLYDDECSLVRACVRACETRRARVGLSSDRHSRGNDSQRPKKNAAFENECLKQQFYSSD